MPSDRQERPAAKRQESKPRDYSPFMRTKVIMDYQTAWAFVKATDPADHHERCSWRNTNACLLCDCDVLWNEYERRGGTRPSV